LPVCAAFGSVPAYPPGQQADQYDGEDGECGVTSDGSVFSTAA